MNEHKFNGWLGRRRRQLLAESVWMVVVFGHVAADLLASAGR